MGGPGSIGTIQPAIPTSKQIQPVIIKKMSIELSDVSFSSFWYRELQGQLLSVINLTEANALFG